MESRRTRCALSTLTLVILAVTGCGGGGDAGGFDAGEGPGTRDARTRGGDASEPDDAGQDADTGKDADTGAEAGVVSDGGPHDAGDPGGNADAGSEDGEDDAGSTDPGNDARPSCTPADCNDNNPCTMDMCDGSGGCQHVNVSNGSQCTNASGHNGLCENGSCQVECTSDADCGDGDVCNGTETCDTSTGQCQDGSPLTCNDDVACTSDSCDSTDGCQHTPEDGMCNDDNPCTQDMCDPENGCQHPNLADDTECTDANGDNGLCQSGSCEVECTDDADCVDDNLCNGEETCNANGQCEAGTPLTCESDDNPCTLDTCDPTLGCVAENESSCTTASIENGQCVHGSCIEPTVFRADSMSFQDPHFILDKTISFTIGSITVDCPFCDDITNQEGSCTESVFDTTQPAPALNPGIDTMISTDGDSDSYLDFSMMAAFKPLVQDGTGGNLVRLVEGQCTDPNTDGVADDCQPDPDSSVDVTTTYNTEPSGSENDCLSSETINGTIFEGTWPDGNSSNVDPVTPGDHGCFVTAPETMTLTFEFPDQTLSITIQHAQFAGEFTGDPATGYTNGLLRGFWRESDADAATIELDQQNVVSVGEDMLPDDGNVCATEGTHCEPADPEMGTSDTPDSRDLRGEGDDETCGWWLYMNITGNRIESWTGF